jgi:hypothetical protein
MMTKKRSFRCRKRWTKKGSKKRGKKKRTRRGRTDMIKWKKRR